MKDIPRGEVRGTNVQKSFLSEHTRKKGKKEKLCRQRKLSTSIKEKETHWLRRAVSLLNHKATKKKKLIGIWRVTGSTRLQNLAVMFLFSIARMNSVAGPTNTQKDSVESHNFSTNEFAE
eukprot:1145922-Pelagomonas_calceolata.AAC.11